MSEFPGNSVSWITSDRGDSIDTKSQHPDFGFPEGRLHQTERAGIAKLLDMFCKNVDFSKFQNLKIEMLEYVWEHFPHIQKSRSRKIQSFCFLN